MIAPIREVDPPPGEQSRTHGDVRRLIASLFLEDAGQPRRPAPAIARWKAWLLIAWATVVTLVYFAAMLDVI